MAAALARGGFGNQARSLCKRGQ